MGRLIDADRLKAHYCWWLGGTKEMTIDEAKRIFDTIIDVQPTVEQPQTNETENMVEIVRCKDCQFYLQSNEKCELVDTRLHFYETDKTWTGDCYCSWGERREGAE